MTPVGQIPLLQHLKALGALYAEARAIAAPYDAQLKHLEVARADATAALTFQIETLQAVIRPLLLAEHRSISVEGCLATYCHKETWDNEALRRFAEEVPTVLQCLRDSSYVVFRRTERVRKAVP